MSLDELFSTGSRAHPHVKLSRGDFSAFVTPLLAQPEPLLAADLFLACAASLNEPGAVSTLERDVLSQVPGFVSRQRLAAHEVDELVQRTRELLLVRGKLKEYAGRGPLGAWLRVLVLRLAAKTRTRQRAHESIDQATHLAVVAHSPEHQLARARWQQTFDQALKDAFDALTTEQRVLFRFQFGKGMTLDQIATALGMHRATAARHIAAAREALWDGLTALLRQRLALPAGEVEALLEEWRSKLDVSLSGIFRESLPG